MTQAPRYDALAEWYDVEIRRLAITPAAVSTLTDLLGAGAGRCLDVGCGTGIAIRDLVRLGWSVTGVDISPDQLRVARLRLGNTPADLIQADAAALPFDDASFDAAVSLFTHTDLDSPGAVFREIARVLRPGGRFVYVGTHPCFITPFVERRPGAAHLLHPGYRRRGWTSAGPGFGQGIRPRVGVNHYTLADFLQMVLDSGLTLTRIDEPGDEDYPMMLSLVARR